MAKRKTGSHISHRLPRVGGKFAKTPSSPSPSQPLATQARSAPPSAGRPVVPLVSTFQALVQSVSGKRVFLPPDVAVQMSRFEADRMLLDPAVKNPLNERFRGTVGAPWHIEAENKADAEQVQMAEGLTKIVKKIPRFQKSLFQLLMAEFHGRSAVNWVYDRVFDGDDRYIGIRQWTPVHGDKLVFSADGTVGVKVGATIPTWMQDKIDQSVLGRVFWFDEQHRPLYTVHRGEIRDGIFEDVWAAGTVEGIGIRHYIYWPWFLKSMALDWILDALERFGAGGLNIWFFEASNPESEAAVRAAAQAQSGLNDLIFPRAVGDQKGGAGFEHVDVVGEGLQYLKDILRDYFDSQIKEAIIGQNLSSKSAATGLGSGVSDFQSNTKQEIIKADAVSLGETLTSELLYPLASFNWPGSVCRCRFVFSVEETDTKALMESAKLFFDLGGELDEDHLRSELGLPKPAEGANVLKKAAAPAAPGDPAASKSGGLSLDDILK